MADNVRNRGQRQELDAVENPKGIFRTTLSYNDQVMICHFTMTKGAEIPLHHHPAAQSGYVISGKVEFRRGEGDKTFLTVPGTGYSFAPDEPHGAHVLEESEVIEVFAPMRPEYADN